MVHDPANVAEGGVARRRRVPDGFQVVRDGALGRWYVDAVGQPPDHRGPGFHLRREAIDWIDEQVASGRPVRGSSWRDGSAVGDWAGYGQAYVLVGPLGLLLSALTGLVLVIAFLALGRSPWAAIGGTIIGGGSGAIVAVVLVDRSAQIVERLEHRIYAGWRFGYMVPDVGLLLSLVLPSILTVVVAVLLS